MDRCLRVAVSHIVTESSYWSTVSPEEAAANVRVRDELPIYDEQERLVAMGEYGGTDQFQAAAVLFHCGILQIELPGEWTRFFHPEVGTPGELRELRRRRRGANEAQGTTNEAMRFCSRFGIRMIVLVYYAEAQHYRVLLPTDEDQGALLAEHHESSMRYFTSVARERAAAYVRGYGGA